MKPVGPAHPPAWVIELGAHPPVPLPEGLSLWTPMFASRRINPGVARGEAHAGEWGCPQESFRAGGWDQPRSIWKIKPNFRQQSPSELETGDLCNCSQVLSAAKHLGPRRAKIVASNQIIRLRSG